MRSDFTLPGAEDHYPPDLGLEPLHLDIALTFDVDARRAAGTVTTRVRANREGATRLRLDAVDLEELSAKDAGGRPLHWQYDGRLLTVTWAEGFTRGEERELALSYAVTEPIAGLHFSVPDEVDPHRARWVATDHETERARYWLPCVDQPAVRTTLDFHLTAPSAFTILANGLLVSEEDHGDGTKTAHWNLDYPCPSYLICMALGEFVSFEDESVDGREIRYYGAKGRSTPEDLGRTFGRTPEIMRWMVEKFGVDFPFPKYYQIALPGIGGAMENISLVSWDDVLVLDEVFARDIGEHVDLVNVHEMAHSYFGDAVVIRDFAHAWLKESWATYTEALWCEDRYGEDDFRYEMHRNARAYMKEADDRYQRPIVTRRFNSSWDMYDLHLYPGGACRIHMLRAMLGDEAFFAAVADYLNRYSRGTVETDEFRHVLERHSGLSLGRFFDEWILGKGYPKLKVTFAFDKEKEEGAFTVTQTQVPEKPGEEEIRPFCFDIDIAWEDAEGAWHRRPVEIRKRDHQFLFAMPEKPKQVRIDPDGSALFRLEFNPGDDMLRHAVRHAPDVVGRILAAEELAKTGKRKNLLAVGEAVAEEKYYGARQGMVEAVADSRAAAAIPLLIGFLERESDPRVLVTIARRMGEYRDERIAGALRDLLGKDLTYRVRATALAALGSQRGETDLEALTEAAGDTGYRSLVRSGALRGLAATRSGAAFETLLERNGYGRETEDARATAADALAEIAAHLSRPRRNVAVERLTDLLRDPRDRVRRAALVGLGKLQAAAAATAAERALATFPEQDHPRLRRSISSMRGGDDEKGATAKLTKAVEELAEKNRKLEEQIDRLAARLEKENGT